MKNNLNELALKLKKNYIYILTRNEQNLDKIALQIKGGKRFTRAELAKEIEDETEIGIKQLGMVMGLSGDLILRQKEDPEGYPIVIER